MKNFLNTSIEEINSLHYKINEKFVNKFLFPFCKKYHLSYIQGNGTYLFKNHKNKILLHPYSDNLPKNTTFLREYHALCDLIDELSSYTNMYGEDFNS